MQFLRSIISVLLSISILVTSVQSSFGQTATSGTVQCNVRTEKDFQRQLESIISGVMSKTLADMKYDNIVDASWRKYKVDKLIDTLVDREEKRFIEEKSTIELVSTITDSKAREELATELAESVYGSEDFQRVVGYIAEDVGKAITAKLDVVSSQAEDSVAECVRKYIGPQYGEAIAVFVSHQTKAEMMVDPESTAPQTGIGDILAASAGGLAGGLLIVLRRAVVQRLTAWLGKRLIGTVIARVVGAFTGIIGWLLIAKEVWDLRHGILPMVAKEMKTKKTKTQVKSELTKGLDIELSKVLKSVPADVAGSIYNIWTRFKEKNKQVLALVKKYPQFRVLLNELRSDNEKVSLSRMRKTQDLVTLLLKDGSETKFVEALETGLLKRAILDLSETGVRIAVETGSIDTAFQWSSAAGSHLKRIFEAGLHRIAKPEEYSPERLQKLFALNDALLIKRVTELGALQRDVLFALPAEEFDKFVREHRSEHLSALSNYVKALSPELSRRFIRSIKSNPAKMVLLSRPEVQYGVINSRDQDAALQMMLRTRSAVEFTHLPADMQLIFKGDVSPVLLWNKQPLAVMIASILALIMLLVLYRLMFRRGKSKK